MADLDLDAIVRIADGDRWCSGPSWRRHYGEDVLALVAEVRRLRAESDGAYDEIVRLRAVLEEVAAMIDDGCTGNAHHALHQALEGDRG